MGINTKIVFIKNTDHNNSVYEKFKPLNDDLYSVAEISVIEKFLKSSSLNCEMYVIDFIDNDNDNDNVVDINNIFCECCKII